MQRHISSSLRLWLWSALFLFSEILFTHAAGVASLNVCADQYAIEFLSKERIASLSNFSINLSFSAAAEKAKDFSRNDGHGESLLFFKPDLLLVGRYDPRAKAQFLSQHGISLFYIEPWTSFAHGREQIRSLSEKLHNPQEGERLIAKLDEALQRLHHLAKKPATILQVQHRLYVASPNSFMSEMIMHAGLTDLVAQGKILPGFVNIETILTAKPDFLMISDGAQRTHDLGGAGLLHPALAKLYPVEKQILLPSLLSICEGPTTPALIDAFAKEVRLKINEVQQAP